MWCKKSINCIVSYIVAWTPVFVLRIIVDFGHLGAHVFGKVKLFLLAQDRHILTRNALQMLFSSFVARHCNLSLGEFFTIFSMFSWWHQSSSKDKDDAGVADCDKKSETWIFLMLIFRYMFVSFYLQKIRCEVDTLKQRPKRRFANYPFSDNTLECKFTGCRLAGWQLARWLASFFLYCTYIIITRKERVIWVSPLRWQWRGDLGRVAIQ